MTSHSGHSNAYTAATSTNYYFELAASSSPEGSSTDVTQQNVPATKEESPLWGALDRFGQFFICPLFLEDTVDREIKAVDSENKKNLQSDTWRLHQLNKALSNPDHPYCHFSTGSWKTLHDDPIERGVKIRDEFMNFHSKHYSANQMKLVVLGREDLDILEQWVEEIFSQVQNKDLPRKRWDDVLVYTEKELLTQTFARPVFESRTLELSFLYRDEEEYYESHPSRYLSHLIGHEGPGSILAYIKAKGWATGLGAGGTSLCPGSGIFNISVTLTEDGLKNYQEVTKIIFQYIAMVREQPPQQWVVDEQIKMSEVAFRFKQKSPPSRTTSALASVMQRPYDRQYLLSGPSVIKRFDAEAISQAMTFLRPDNFRLNIVSQDFPGDWNQKEKWYGTEYKTGKMSEDFLAEIQKTFDNPKRPEEIHFPHKNEFIPNRLDVEKKEVAEPAKTPKLIRNDEGVRAWFKKDDQFWVPKANVYIYLRTPLSHLTARTSVLTSLYRELVQDALVEYSYDADISGLVYEFNNHSTGLSVSVEGYNDKLHVLLEKVLISLRDLEVREDRFNISKDRLVRGFRNWDFGQPFHQVGTFSRWLKNSTKIFMTDELLKEFDGITAQDVQEFYPQLLAQCHIEVLAHGNLHKEEALQITDLAEKILKPKHLPVSQWSSRRNLLLPPGSNFIYERQLKDPANVNHCIEYSLFMGLVSDRDLRAKILLIAQMTDEPAFNQLRTIEQLGYVVFSGPVFGDTWAGYRVLIQSEKDCRYLEGRIEHFLNQFEKTLAEMSEEDFESHKRAVINKRLEKLKNLTQEGNRFWNHMFSDMYDFLLGKWCPLSLSCGSSEKLIMSNVADEDVKHTKPLTKAQIQETFAHYISPVSSHRAKLSVHLIAQAKAPQPTLEEKKAQALAQFTTILAEEHITTPNPDTLTSRLTGASSESEIIDALSTHLTEDIKVTEKEKIDKILDEARAALGLAEVDEMLEDPKVLTRAETAESLSAGAAGAREPVIVTDVPAWKAGLTLSSAARPVRDLNDFVEGAPKL